MYNNNKDSAERLDIQISAGGQPFKRIPNTSNESFTLDETGFGVATCEVQRDFNSSWADLPPGSLLRFVPQYADFSGIVAWDGFLSGVEPTIQNKKPVSIILTGMGRTALNDNLYFKGVLGTGQSPEQLIAALITGGYLPNLSNDTTKLLTTGLSGKTYQTANGGTSEESVASIVDALCGWGNSTAGQRVIHQVFELGVLQTKALTATPTATYRIPKSAIDNLGLSRNIMDLATRIIVKYNGGGSPLPLVFEDTSSQSAYSISWQKLGAAFDNRTVVPFVRTHLIDITSLGILPDATLPTAIGNLALARLKQLQSESSQALVLNKDFAVKDVAKGCSIPNWQVRPGCWVEIPDLYPTLTIEYGSNSVLSNNNLFYISKTNYTLSTGQLELTPEKSSKIIDALAQIGAGANSMGMGGGF